MYYLRKIEESQWRGKVLHDAVSISDLRTKDNDISVWENDGTHESINKLALAFSLTTGRIQDLWCVNIPEDSLDGFKFHPAPSSTPYITMKNSHTNIVIPTLYEMGDLAEIIYNMIVKRNLLYIAEQDIKNCFYDAVLSDEMSLDFNEKRYRQFRKPLEDIEKDKGAIDFSKLKNVKEVINYKTKKIARSRGN